MAGPKPEFHLKATIIEVRGMLQQGKKTSYLKKMLQGRGLTDLEIEMVFDGISEETTDGSDTESDISLELEVPTKTAQNPHAAQVSEVPDISKISSPLLEAEKTSRIRRMIFGERNIEIGEIPKEKRTNYSFGLIEKYEKKYVRKPAAWTYGFLIIFQKIVSLATSVWVFIFLVGLGIIWLGGYLQSPEVERKFQETFVVTGERPRSLGAQPTPTPTSPVIDNETVRRHLEMRKAQKSPTSDIQRQK